MNPSSNSDESAVMQPAPDGSAVQDGTRPDSYYSAERREIADLVPATSRRVLEIGCGEGCLGQLLRSRGHYVAGVELVPAVADKARACLDEVFCGNVERAQLPWGADRFDVIIMADVLEHLVDPWAALQKLTAMLSPGGRVIASIPNVQNHRIIKNLIRGRWEYADSGLMDVGHLRFFTWRQIVRTFEQAGLQVVYRRCLYNRSLKRRIMLALSLGRIEPFLTRQYLVVGQKQSPARQGDL